jgi:hypothetical protein
MKELLLTSQINQLDFDYKQLKMIYYLFLIFLIFLY